MTHRLSSILLPLLLALAFAPSSARADSSAASSAFTFDARYPALGGMPEEWNVQEVQALSGLFALRTRPLAEDTDDDALGVGDRQGGLACYGSWGSKESNTTEQLN